jgi:ribokinase
VRTDTVDRVDTPTGTALITVSPDGENAIVVAPGANSHVRIGAVQTERIAAADVVLAQLEIPLDTVLEAARARREGALFVLNAAPSRDLPDELWEQLDVLVVNEHEAADLVGGAAATPEDLAAALLDRVPAVVVTLGARGSLVVRRGEAAVRVPAAKVTAVDTTGAGDTYCGVLAAGLAQRPAELVHAARLEADDVVALAGTWAGTPPVERTREAP